MKTRKNDLSYYQINKKRLSIRQWVYLVIITFAVMSVFMPYVAHADLFGTDIPDLYLEITEKVQETNELLNFALDFALISPYEVINTLTGSNATMCRNLITASKTVALVVATLLLMMDFLKKSVSFEWSSKWENILLFLVKIIIAKQIIQNSDVIISSIYSGFNYIFTQVTASNVSIDFLPCETDTYYIFIPDGWKEYLDKSFGEHIFDLVVPGGSGKHEPFVLSEEAVKMFYPEAVFPKAGEVTIEDFENPTSKLNFSPTIEIIVLQPYFLVMKAVAVVIFVIVVGRIFELCIYTLMAPLPLATLASDTTSDIARNFIKSYIAVVLQATMFIVMFIVYIAVNNYFTTTLAAEDTGLLKIKLIQFVILISLALGIAKSESWSKKLCGA